MKTFAARSSYFNSIVVNSFRFLSLFFSPQGSKMTSQLVRAEPTGEEGLLDHPLSQGEGSAPGQVSPAQARLGQLPGRTPAEAEAQEGEEGEAAPPPGSSRATRLLSPLL